MEGDLSLTIISDTSSNAKICLELSPSCYQDNKTDIKISIKDGVGCVSYENYSTLTTESNNCIPYVAFPINEDCVESYHLEIKAYNTTAYSQPLLTVPGDYDYLHSHDIAVKLSDHFFFQKRLHQ